MKNAFFFLFFFSFSFLYPLEEVDYINIVDKDNHLILNVERKQLYLVVKDPLFINNEKINEIINQARKKQNQLPKNAYFKNKKEIVKEQKGKVIDELHLKKQLKKAIFNKELKTLQVNYKMIEPKIKKEDLLNIKQSELASFTTYYDKDNYNRSKNIRLATKAIDHYIVPASESFSFNQVVGKRTSERGYEKAPIIVEGKLSEDIGGGICQVSSTLYNAVKSLNVKIEERNAHTKEVPYVPKGDDAAVSWNHLDFIFKNNYTTPLLIQASAKDGVLSIKIYGNHSTM